MSDVITALKRLERAGAEQGKTAEKLKSATTELANYLVDLLPAVDYGDDLEAGIRLPRGYCIDPGGSLSTGAWSEGGMVLSRHPEDITRTDALHLAHDIATGWLDELAAWLEDENAENENAAETLRRASAAARAATPSLAASAEVARAR